jgi:hypothetical protein
MPYNHAANDAFATTLSSSHPLRCMGRASAEVRKKGKEKMNELA